MGKTSLQFTSKSLLVVLPLLLVSLGVNLYFLSKDKTRLKSADITVVRVVDGDTFDAGGELRVRLAGADAPEYPKECLAEESKQRLNSLIAGKTVKIAEKEKDDFGRLVAWVWVGDLFVDKALVSEGLAESANTGDPSYGVQIAQSEEEAKAGGRGIWSEKCLQPADSACTIKGNVRRDRKTRVYHLPGCFNYNKIVIDEREGDSWFCNEEEAKSAGFTKSEDCP